MNARIRFGDPAAGTDTFLVSYDYRPEKDNAVLIVGRPRLGTHGVEIINAFAGDEAKELYEKLTSVKKEEEELI